MDKKKLLIIGGAFLALVIIVIIISLILPKGNGGAPSDLSPVQKVVLAKGETADRTPVDPTNVFSVSDPEIHAIISFYNVPANTDVTYRWVSLADGQIIKEEKRRPTTIFTGLGSSSIIKDEKLTWGIGNFEFRVLLNDRIYNRSPFRVLTEKDLEKENILSSISNVALTTAVDITGKPTRNPGQVFGIDDQNIYASITYTNIPRQINLEGRWIYLGDSRTIDRFQKSISGSGSFAFNIDSRVHSWIPTRKWVVGKYMLEIYLDGEKIKETPFSIK